MLNQLKTQKKDTKSSDAKLSVSDAIKLADDASSSLEKAEKKPAEDEKNIQLSDQIGVSPIEMPVQDEIIDQSDIQVD